MKKYMCITVSILFLLIILLLPKDIIPKKIEIDYEVIKQDTPVYIYYVKNENIIGYPIHIEEKNKFKLINIVFTYLTEKSNSVSKEYHSELNLSSKLLSYDIRNNDIYLEVSDDFYKIKDEDTILALAQVLYTYKELGYDEVYLTKDGKIKSQMADVILYDGIKELAVNIDMKNTSSSTKTVRITYYYKDKTKGFINHIINKNEDEISFKLKKLIEFVNKEYKLDVKLVNIIKTDEFLNINLTCSSNDTMILKELLIKNLSVKEHNIIIN